MQWHSLQFSASDPGDSGRALLPGNVLEASAPGNCWTVYDGFKEWSANFYTHTARQLCRSGVLVWPAAPRGRCRFLLAGIIVIGTAIVGAAAK